MNFLEMNGLQTAQTHFKDIFQNNIHRDYADAMLDWLEPVSYTHLTLPTILRV